MKKALLFISIFYFLFSSFSVASAATTLEVGIPGAPVGESGKVTVSDPSQYISFVYLFVLGFVGIAGFVTLVIWGTAWIASGVGPDKKAAALEGIRNSLIGIGIAFLAFIMLNTINPDLVANRAPTVGEIRNEPRKSVPVVDPWLTARHEWFCAENAPNLHEWELERSSSCGTPPLMNCAGGKAPSCFTEYPLLH